MKPGICAGCRKGRNCRFRQPGTWVVECEEFEKRPVPMQTGLALREFADLEGRRTDRPGA